MKGKRFLTILVAVAAAMLMTSPPASAVPAPASLGLAVQALEREFQRLDTGLQRAARTLGTTGLTGEKARAALARLCGTAWRLVAIQVAR